MVDNSRIMLENNKEYLVIDKIEVDGKYFVYLSNIDDSEDFCARKEIEVDDKKILVGLDNKEEADLALKVFSEKHKND